MKKQLIHNSLEQLIIRPYKPKDAEVEEPDHFYPITAVDANGPVGHLIMRYTNKAKTIIRLGFIIVDDSKRGMGYGKRMIKQLDLMKFL